MSTTQEYIKPAAQAVPPLLLLRVFSWLSTCALLVGGYVLVKIIAWDFSEDSYSCGYYMQRSCDSGYTLEQWLIPVVLGVVAHILLYSLKSYYYWVVLQGTVVGKDFRITNGWSQHSLKLYGYNRAGEMTYYWMAVTSGAYDKYNDGDFVDFR